MKTRTLALAAVAMFAVCAAATQYSKLSIITGAKERGVWQGVKAWIVAADLEDEWTACSYLSDDHPRFAEITNAVVQAGVMSADDLAYLMSRSTDTAIPDALIRRVYSNDCNSASGRSKWHGKKLSETVDTNTLTKVTVYEDGKTFTDKARIVRPIDAVQAANARLKAASMTNGVPARLAQARLRRVENASKTNVVSVVLAPEGN